MEWHKENVKWSLPVTPTIILYPKCYQIIIKFIMCMHTLDMTSILALFCHWDGECLLLVLETPGNCLSISLMKIIKDF